MHAFAEPPADKDTVVPPPPTPSIAAHEAKIERLAGASKKPPKGGGKGAKGKGEGEGKGKRKGKKGGGLN